MKKNLLLLTPVVLLITITIILLPNRLSAQDNVPLTWVTSKAEAVTKALSEGKYILLLAGASYCQHCYNMHYVVSETNNPPIKAVIEENYVPWYCDIMVSDEYKPYSTEPYIPLTCRIDPRDPEKFIDQSYGSYLNHEQTFYNRLLSGLGDIDSDGMPDAWERLNGLDALFNDAANDPDNDGLKNIDEYTAGTNPKNSDTDGDGMPDGWEVQYGLNPLVNDTDGDLDNDGWSNLKEYLKGTKPDDPKSRPTRTMPWLPLLLENN
ncbi:MAG: DUF255 domain-containing protein [Desulfatiglans sp.]|nr:DUF255 domain-containing protein [Desulfatiglans sp.]